MRAVSEQVGDVPSVHLIVDPGGTWAARIPPAFRHQEPMVRGERFLFDVPLAAATAPVNENRGRALPEDLHV